MSDQPVVLDLDDAYFDGQTLPDALRDYGHVHSTTGVCVKNIHGPACDSPAPTCPDCAALQARLRTLEAKLTAARLALAACREVREARDA